MTREHSEKHVAKGLTLEGPATYQIRIKGRLEEYWSERLEGMRLMTSDQEEHVQITELVGQLLDQAALLGVLNTLYDLRVPILSVTCLETTAQD